MREYEKTEIATEKDKEKKRYKVAEVWHKRSKARTEVEFKWVPLPKQTH